jgi:16S rRNA (cytosine967-C5)-methyltransferase
LLARAARCVAPGGLLIYSTCSLEPEENADQVARFLERHSDFVLEPPPADTIPGAMIEAGMLHVLPHVQQSDGAFAARLRRR